MTDLPMPDDWAQLLCAKEDPDQEYDPSEDTQLIKTVASAYFVHIPSTAANCQSIWINLANVISVSEFGSRITVRFTNESSLTFDGFQRDSLLLALGEVTR